MPAVYTYRPKQHKKAKIIVFLTVLFASFFVWHVAIDRGDSVAQAKTNSNIDAGSQHSSAQMIPLAPVDLNSTDVATSTLQSDWAKIIASRQGDIDIAVYNQKTGQTTHYSNVSETFNTASVVKVSILEALLVNDQYVGQAMTADESTDAAQMIENSDNDSATELWSDVGGTAAMNRLFGQLGMTSTVAGSDAWGLTQTTALDQLKVMNAVAYPNLLLNSTSMTTANQLLDQVESDQTWGVSAGLPSNVSYELKDGWLDDAETNDQYSNTSDWTVNSIGHIHGDGADYTIAVLSEGDTSEQYGIDTIQDLSGVTWTDISTD